MGRHCTIAWTTCISFYLASFVSCHWPYHSKLSHHGNPRRSKQPSSVVGQRPVMLSGGHVEYLKGWAEKEPLVSGVLMEDIAEDELTDFDRLRKREAPERGFYQETQQMLLDFHNLYRSNVTPPASNMAHMEWDDELAYYAQLWADYCVFEHGTPLNTAYSRGVYGQNLYFGHDPTSYNAMYLWYEEYKYYDLRTQYCQPGQQCGHYVQMAWADSDRLGCGIRKCGMRYLIVCHYHGPAIRGQQMYSIGLPCSQCSNERGSLCRNNLCFSFEQCERLPHLCGDARCTLHCHNCGRLNKTTCQCDCADGFDSSDCSRPCRDEHERCGVNPGFPNKSTCPMNRNAVAKKYCRKMCGECTAIVPGNSHKGTCCDEKVCEDGSVLNSKCQCTQLCPGPKCDESSGVYRQQDVKSLLFMYLFAFILKLYFTRFI